MASQNIIMPPMRCRCCLPCCSWPQLCVVCLLWDFDLHRPPPNPVPALHSCPHLTGGIETEKLARGTLHFKHLWRLMDGSCQFIASLTNTIFSLSLTKRTERSLSLHNALQLDFYLLPDFRVNLVVPKFQHLPNRTDWHTTCFSQNRLNQQHVYLVHFSFFLPSLILLAVFVTDAQFPVLLHTAVSMFVGGYDFHYCTWSLHRLSLMRNVGEELGSTLPTCRHVIQLSPNSQTKSGHRIAHHMFEFIVHKLCFALTVSYLFVSC